MWRGRVPDRTTSDQIKIKDGGQECPSHKANGLMELGLSGSDPHGHDDVAILVVLAIGGAKLTGRLRVFEFELYVSRANCFQEIQNVLGVKADGQRIALVAGFERVFRFSSFGG